MFILREVERHILEEINWARVAALFDGEGTFRKQHAEINIAMCDEDLIIFIKEVTQAPNKITTRQLPSGKTQYRLHITGKALVERCLLRMIPYLGIRRTAQSQEILDRITNSKYSYA